MATPNMDDYRPIEPELIRRFLGENAARHLSEYFNSGNYTGGRFERFAGAADQSTEADRFHSDDIVAVSMLSVRIPGRPAVALLEERSAEFAGLLSDIPNDVDLWHADDETIGPASAAHRLWSELSGLNGVGWVTAHKLLARKRPRLLPVYDRVVRNALERKVKDEWWRPLRDVLTDNSDVVDRLDELRTIARLDDIAILRILDVCIWMTANGRPEPVPDAET
jgi:hypothetical protein